MGTPLLSVIVPVYKAEATLDACVQSILAQTLADFELLLIDDESPDNCPALCDAWAQKDPRIRALHPKKQVPVLPVPATPGWMPPGVPGSPWWTAMTP